jgi:hypothetical protein
MGGNCYLHRKQSLSNREKQKIEREKGVKKML